MMSRADITRALQLSKVTVSAVVSELIEEGLVKEIGEGNSLPSGGKKASAPLPEYGSEVCDWNRCRQDEHRLRHEQPPR